MRLIRVVALIGLLSPFLLPQPVHAADTGTCSEATAVHRFKGFGEVVVGVAGSEAKLENQVLNICTSATDDNRSNHIWVAVDDNGGNASDLVQAGLVRCIASAIPDCTNFGTHQFYAWGRSHLAAGCAGFSDVAPVQRWMGNFPSGILPYTVVRTSTQWQIKVNGSVTQTIPTSSICWSSKRALYTGESWDIRDAIGGPVDNPFRLSSAIYEASVGGAWSNTNWGTGAICNISSDARYKCNAPTGTSMDLWTVQP